LLQGAGKSPAYGSACAYHQRSVIVLKKTCHIGNLTLQGRPSDGHGLAPVAFKSTGGTLRYSRCHRLERDLLRTSALCPLRRIKISAVFPINFPNFRKY